MKIIIASDSFKGCLTSRRVEDAIARGIRKIIPLADITTIPVADGGEGTVAALADPLGAEIINCDTLNPALRPISSTYAILRKNDTSTAIMEVASCCGLSTVQARDRQILQLTTFGLGLMIADAYRKGCRNFAIALGGSATCDAGIGLFSAIGFRFLDSSGRKLNAIPSSLPDIAEIESSSSIIDINECCFTLIADVKSPLCGPSGAARMFAPQKGASPEQVSFLEDGMKSYSEVLMKKTGVNICDKPSSGAAGGIAASFMAFTRATVLSGADAVLDITGFDSHLRDADLVITGEGSMDKQTLQGKLPYGICLRAAKASVPTVALAGCVSDMTLLLDAGFAAIFPICTHPMSLTEAMNPTVAAQNLETVSASVASLYSRSR